MWIKIKYLSLFLFLLNFKGICQEIENPSAPDFSGKITAGKEIKLSDYQGKVVLIDFWASWCSPCREEMPELIKFYKAINNPNFEIIAVNIDNDIENMNHFLDKLSPKPGFPIFIDDKQQVPPLFKIEAMPTTIFIDKKGLIRYRHDGFKKSYLDEFKKELSQLLKEN